MAMVQRDLFDTLPYDLIIREILPRLGSIKRIRRLSKVSRTFKTLCRFSPVLEIDKLTDDIVHYVDDFFAFHSTNSHLKFEFKRFKFSLKKIRQKHSTKIYKIHNWFHDALSLNIQELILRIEPKYYLIERHLILLEPSSSFPLKYLRVLKLENLPIALAANFDDWISNCCVALEELHIVETYIYAEKFRIASSNLRVLMMDSHFREIEIARAPKLVELTVMWNLIHEVEKDDDLRLRVSLAPNLERFTLANWCSPIAIEYCYCCDGGGGRRRGEGNFPSLQNVEIVFPEVAMLSLASLGRLMRDISCTKSLIVSETFLHQLSLQETYFLSLDKLQDLHVLVDVIKSRWTEQANAILSFLREIPSLKILKITNDLGYDPASSSNEFIEALVNDVFKFGISRPARKLNPNTVKIQLSKGENVTMLVQSLLKDAPPDTTLIISFPS